MKEITGQYIYLSGTPWISGSGKKLKILLWYLVVGEFTKDVRIKG